MNYIRLLLAGSFSFFAVCAAQDIPQDIAPPESAETATVIVYRPQTSFHSANPERPFLFIDEKQAGNLGVGQSVTLRLSLGRHIFSMRSSFLFMPGSQVGLIDLVLEPGQTYYLRYEYGFSRVTGTPGIPVPVGRHSFGQVSREIGETRK